MSRTPWPSDFPPCLVHVPWNISGSVSLRNHPLYERAKRNGDGVAALNVISEILDSAIVDRLIDAWTNRSQPPVVVALTAAEQGAKNALPLAYASWLARDLGFELCATLYQFHTVKRDLEDGWKRLAFPAAVDGKIPQNREFIVCDDVCTLGGTLAETRSFIERNGGKVIATTCLASPTGKNVQLGLSETTQYGLAKKFGVELTDFWKGEFGYDEKCLTDPEGNYLLTNARNVQQIRDGICGARSGGDAQRNSGKA